MPEDSPIQRITLDELDEIEFIPVSDLPPDQQPIGYTALWVDPVSILDDDILE